MRSGYRIRAAARRAAWGLLATAVVWRAAVMIKSLQAGDASWLLVFPFGAVLPALLLVILSMLPPTRTREGLLMRVGAMIQLWLVIIFPVAALYLTLGFPVVFLVVELFETRLPPRLREPMARLVVA